MEKMNVLIKAAFFLLPVLILLAAPGCYTTSSQSNMNQTARSNTIQSDRNGYNLDDLNSYGEWVQINNYGNVWRPFVVNDWEPYNNGHWDYADGNWTWISYEPFGWIVYHYGNWYNDPYYGWVWIPSNNVWSPARVVWVDYGNYIGWAPQPPAGIVYANPWESNGSRYWHVVRHKDFTEDNINKYRIRNPDRNENGGRNEVKNKPPGRNVIERTSGRPVPEVRIQRETVKLPDKQIQRMDLPPQEKKRVEQNAPRVRNEVLVPPDKYRKQQSEQRQEPKKETRKK